MKTGENVWQEWLLFVIRKAGSSRKASETTEEALGDHTKNHATDAS